MMAIKHNTKKHICQERPEGGSPGTSGDGGHVHEVLEAAWHLAFVGLVLGLQ
jgi:hypothetical protein